MDGYDKKKRMELLFMVLLLMGVLMVSQKKCYGLW